MKILGVACGIASVGWSLLDIRARSMRVVAAGVWSFDPPETPKERTPLAAVRRGHRGQRRVIRRRRQRMNQLRRLFHDTDLLTHAGSGALSQKGLDPWALRAAAFARSLSGAELAVALGHIAGHRGFKSNSLRAGRNQADETRAMNRATAGMAQRLARYRTVGLMFAAEPEFADRKRNRGDFTRSVLRADLEHEARQIFAEQRRRGNALASADLEEAYHRIAFHQRPLQDGEHLVGACRFEPAEWRTARRGYGFELFRLLSRLSNLSLVVDGRHTRLSAAMIRAISADFGAVKRISYRSVRETLRLGDDVRFLGVRREDEKNDVVARQGNAAEGSHTLRQVVGAEGWTMLMRRPELRDRIAEVLSFRSDPGSISQGLAAAGLEGDALEAIIAGVEAGGFSQFNGAGHLSAKATRALLPGLRRGLGYAAACAAIGYDHDAPAKVSLEDVRNPVARKALGEVIKQLRAIMAQHGRPDAIHLGLQRALGKSAEERDRISRGIEDQNKKRERSRLELAELLGRDSAGDELLRYELWKEQGGRCLYSGAAIDPSWIAAGDNTVQINHILPWSRFGDDSFLNKTLCLARAGAAKQDRTPYEWLGQDKAAWEAFSARVETCKDVKGRKKAGFYLRQNAAEVEEDFRNRQLSDSRYVARALLLYLGQVCPGTRLRARPTQLTAKLRRAWGLDDLKHDASGERVADERHRAVDAIVLAAISERTLEDLTRAAKIAERQGLPRGFDFSQLAPPIERFRDVVCDAVADVFIARTERRRMGGEIHAATIKRIGRTTGAAVVYDRKPVEKLTLGDLERIPTPAPYGRITNPARLRDEMVSGLRRWIERGRPKDDPPRSPKGDVIRKVRVASGEEVKVKVRGGTADRGDMARVDVFRAAARDGRPRYHLVPIYPHQVVDPKAWPSPPDRAVVPNKPEPQWTSVSGLEFLFSLFSHSLVEAIKPDGEVIRGYFKGLDRANGAIAVAAPENSRAPPRRTGAKTLRGFEKLRVDRLGRITPVAREVRTWRGEVCT